MEGVVPCPIPACKKGYIDKELGERYYDRLESCFKKGGKK